MSSHTRRRPAGAAPPAPRSAIRGRVLPCRRPNFPAPQEPTPRVDQLRIDFQDLPFRVPAFPYDALEPVLAENPGPELACGPFLPKGFPVDIPACAVE